MTQKDKKVTIDNQLEEMRAWSVLIPRVEEILESKIQPGWKCVLIEYVIKQERKSK